MGTITVLENVTLDGVLQAPGAVDSDPDFPYAGWAEPYSDRVMNETMGKGMVADSRLLFGRRTYELMHRSWAGRTDGNPFTEVLDRKQKFVVSRTLAEPLPWQNSTLVTGDLKSFKDSVDGDIGVLGSGQLVRSLLAEGLVDVLTLSIHPLTLGAGTRRFDSPGWAAYDLVSAIPTTTGVIIATYRTRTAS